MAYQATERPDSGERARVIAEAAERGGIRLSPGEIQGLSMRGRADLAQGMPGMSQEQYRTLNRKLDQVQKKESFLGKVVKFPFRHPYLTAAGVFGALWYTGMGSSIFARIQDWVATAPDRRVASIARGVTPAIAPTAPMGIGPGVLTIPSVPLPGATGAAGPIIP